MIAPDTTAMAATLRHEAAGALLGTVFSMVGLCAIILSQFRRPQRDLTLVSFGVFCSLYGVRLLAGLTSVQVVIGRELPWAFLATFITYVIGIPATVFYIQLLGPGWRSSLRVLFWLSIAFACVAVFSDVLQGEPFTMRVPNAVLVIAGGAVMLINLFRPGVPVSPDLWALRGGFTILAVFLLVENLRSLGVILGGTNYEPLGFTAFVGALGFVAARRFLDNEKQLLALQSELATARHIQSAILPRQVPAVRGIEVAARYVPMTAVAGDFYDFLPIDDRRLGILVADVSGHGVPAALIASMVKVAFASQAERATDPAQVLNGMNQVFCGKIEEGFITACYLLFDTEAGKLRYASAGHPPALLWRGDGGRLLECAESGIILGRFPQARFKNTALPLMPGDRILVYTDGVLEAANRAGEFFGDTQLKPLIKSHIDLAPGDFADLLLERLAAWSGKAALDDDVTIVAVDFQRDYKA
jgi:sigma-B regulation protein RsbU (phosphoserine phosphatase)